MEIKVFSYVKEIDCFVVTPVFAEICGLLEMHGWDQLAWIGRYFMLDNDYGEHWFDNWNERDEKEAEALKLGIDYEQILVVLPKRFVNNADGPCHTDEQRELFWTNVLQSLTLSVEVIIAEARIYHAGEESDFPELDARIKQVMERYA